MDRGCSRNRPCPTIPGTPESGHKPCLVASACWVGLVRGWSGPGLQQWCSLDPVAPSVPSTLDSCFLIALEGGLVALPVPRSVAVLAWPALCRSPAGLCLQVSR